VSWFADKIIKWRSCKPELYLEMFSWINYGKIRVFFYWVKICFF
jgi:hypothetical protein